MTKSKKLFTAASRLMPGGVNSPVRAWAGMAEAPRFIERGKGAYLIDVDDKKYIDYVGSWGPLIVGHAHPYILQKVTKALENGLSFGAPTEVEVQFAQKICELMPAIEMLRFVSSGTEAAMSAIRVARGFTGRDKIIKFSGCYHGHADSLLVSAGSGGLTFSVPNSAGVPISIAEHTLVAEFNKIAQVEALFAQYPNQIAGVIVEPVAANMNLVLPLPGFLESLRELCNQYQSVLIFDEVITGFRMGLGGAQAYYGVKPDLTVLGKIIGGGFPAAAFGGRCDIMQTVAPLGSVYQAGTLSGHPLAMTAGLATLELLSAPHFYLELQKKNQTLVDGLNKSAETHGVESFSIRAGAGMFGIFFNRLNSLTSLAEVQGCDFKNFKRFFQEMLALGIYLAPSPFEIGFLSSAHSDLDIMQTIEAANSVFTNFA